MERGLEIFRQERAQRRVQQRYYPYLCGKRVLDVGFGLGYDAAAIRNKSAIVYGVEPDKECYDYAISHGLIDADKAFNCKVQDIPEELYGTFDFVCVLAYCIPLAETEATFETLVKLVADRGEVIIELLDRIYVYGDKFVEPIPSVASRYFAGTRLRPIDKGFLLKADTPILINERGSIKAS